MDLKQHIRSVPDFPKPGILFYDISTLLAHPEAWQTTVHRLADALRPHQPDLLVGIESRGFLVAAPLAYQLGRGFAMVRKQGKLPGRTARFTYDLEYGTDTIEIQEDAIKPGQRIVVLDDLLATGGTMQAAINLVRQRGGIATAAAVLLERTQSHRRAVHIDGRLRELIIGHRRRGTKAAPDHRVKRIPAAWRRPIETADIGPVSGLDEMLGNQAEMPGVVEKAPASDRARRHTAVRECHDQRRARLQDAPGIAYDFAGPRQMLHRHADCRAVKFAGSERQMRIAVQIL